MLPPPRWCARRTWPSRMAVEMTGILNECRPRLRCLRAMLKCLRPDAARDLRRRCDPRERRPEERLAERLLCRCCHRQRGFDGPHGFPFRAMHTAPGPAGARPILKRRLAVTSTRQPDDPLLHVLAEVDVRLVHLEVDPREDVDQALHLPTVRLLVGHSEKSSQVSPQILQGWTLSNANQPACHAVALRSCHQSSSPVILSPTRPLQARCGRP